MTIFLRFESKEQWESFQSIAYDTFCGYDGKDTLVAKSGFTFDVIGDLYSEGIYDVGGNVITPPVLLPGYHVNMLGEVPEEFNPFVLNPTSPRRRFFL